MSYAASPPPDIPGDSSSASGSAAASPNFALLYVTVAVLVGVVLYLAVRHVRSVLSTSSGLFGLGLSEDDIAALPTFTYRAPQRNGVECAVCLQELEDGDTVRVLPACRHFFHGGCVDAWLRAHPSCPVCRAHTEPPLRPCGVSPERPLPASRNILADLLARSPLRLGARSPKPPSPAPTARGYILPRSASQSTPPPQMLEVVVTRSNRSPSPMRFGRQSSTARCVGVLEGIDVMRSASPSPVTARDRRGQ